MKMFDFNQPVGVFSPEHLLFLALAALFGAAVIYVGGQLDDKDRSKLLIALWAAFSVIELSKYVRFGFHPDEFDARTGLPFHLCSISIFTYPPAVLTKNETFRNFIYAVNMPGALFALITPDVGNASAFSFYFLHLIVAHTFIVLIPLYMVLCGFFRPDVRRLPGVAALFALTALPALVLNRLLDSNYYFINGPVRGTLTQQFADWCGEGAYLLPMAGLLLLVWGVLYAPFILTRNRPADFSGKE